MKVTPTVDEAIGTELHGWIRDLLPIPRSLTGEGVRATLQYLDDILGGACLQRTEVPSGTRVFDWEVPDEWHVREAYLVGPDGRKRCAFGANPLHLVGYSEPVRARMSLSSLQERLHSLPEMPNAIPYVTSYYRRTWGFCLSQGERDSLPDGDYDVVIDSVLQPGSLTYADYVLPGRSEEEVLLSSYVCHPAMANNELSGPVVTVAIMRWLKSLPNRRYTYRMVLGPETIGAIAYLSRNLAHMKQRLVAGFVLTCIGDDGPFSCVHSRYGDTLADRLVRSVLHHYYPTKSREHSFLERGSDERQYCSPGVDLPVVTLMRTKFGSYPEYHTSADDLSLVTPTALAASFNFVRMCIELLEINVRPEALVACEPQLGRRNLYASLSSKGSAALSRVYRDVLAYADGRNDIFEMAALLDRDPLQIFEAAALLREHELIRF